jgi:hypothetical protein
MVSSSCWSIQARKLTPLIGPSKTQGAAIPSERRAATKVRVRQ